MQNQTSVQILASIKKIKAFVDSKDEDNLDAINEHLSNGWIIIATRKSVDEYGNETLIFFLGYSQEQPKSH